ncbi:MAG: hypothetical protein ACPG31_03985 [Planctomycetota bacterium]
MLSKVILVMMVPTLIVGGIRVWLDHAWVASQASGFEQRNPRVQRSIPGADSISGYTSERLRYLKDESLTKEQRRALLLAMFELEAGRVEEGILALGQVPLEVWRKPSIRVGDLLLASGQAGNKEVCREMLRLDWLSLPPSPEADRTRNLYLDMDEIWGMLQAPMVDLLSTNCTFE